MKRITFLLVCIAILGCEKKEDEDKGGESLPLEINRADYATYTVESEHPQIEIETSFPDEVSSFESPAYEGAALLEEADCGTKVLGDTIVHATKEQLSFDMSVDLTSCILEQLPDSGVTKYMFGMKATFACDGESDLSVYDGKKFSEIPEGDTPCVDSKAFSSRTLVDIEMDMPLVSVEGQTTTKTRIASVCDFTQEGTTVKNGEECFDASSFTGKATVGEEEYPIGGGNFYDLAGLTYEDDAQKRWYAIGEAKIKFQEWEGTVAFAGTNEPPSWTLTNGSETVTGTFAESLKASGKKWSKALARKILFKK